MPAKLEPVLLALAGQAPPQTTEPLAALFRAIELIVGTTPDKIDGKPRDILIRNEKERGKEYARIEAVCEAYSFPGASMKLADWVGDLAEDDAYIISATDAAYLLGALDKHQGWTLSSKGVIAAPSLQQPVKLKPLSTPGAYRVAAPAPTPASPLMTLSGTLQGVIDYFEHQREDLKRRNGKRNETRPFPGSLELSIQDQKLGIRLPTTRLTTDLGETSAQTDFDGRTLSVKDIERLATSLVEHGVDTNGWIVNGQVEGAGLVLETHLDNDLFRVVIPTRTGDAYNQICEDLVL